jgi:hypothetical protein
MGALMFGGGWMRILMDVWGFREAGMTGGFLI